MSELNPELTPLPAIDTNAEYILPAEEKKQPPVLLSVSKAIIVETVKDFFGSIIGFFWRYIKHFFRCFIYFFNPSLQKKPFDRLDFKENSKHAFEFLLIVLALIIFMEKVEWIPQASKELLAEYNNDLNQKLIELFIFVFFAISYLILATLIVLLGRLARKVFAMKVSRDESDILMVYYNNSFFSIAAVISMVLRCMASLEANDEEGLTNLLMIIFLPSALLLNLIWAIRFSYLHRVGVVKGILFTLATTIIYGFIYFFISYMICVIVLVL